MTGAARGIPDEAIYHILAALFYAAPRLLYEIHIDAEEPVTFPPSTLIIANHKRDLDSVILPAALYRLQRPRRPFEFAGREDMFVRGFLAGYDVVPRWLRRLLYEIDLTAVLAALRIHPVRRFPERTMEEALREALQLFGDVPLTDVLMDERQPPGATGLHLSQALLWKRRAWWRSTASMVAFRPALRGRLAERQRAVVERQIEELVLALRRGAILYFAPEGVVSPDGSFQPFRAGVRLVLERAPGVAVRPACIVYDFMRPGRLRVFIRTGRLTAPGATRGAVAAIRRDLAALHTMTASQLCSQIVWDRLGGGEPAVDPRSLPQAVVDLARTVAAEGLPVDGALLDDASRRVDGWVAYVLRRRIGRLRGGMLRFEGWILTAPATHWANPVRYCANEVRSVRAALSG